MSLYNVSVTWSQPQDEKDRVYRKNINQNPHKKMKKSQAHQDTNQVAQLVTAKIALETIFPEETIDNLIKVARASGNASVAVLMLLNRYEEPKLPHYVVDNDTEHDVEFIAYDPFQDLVKYSYRRIRTKQAWFKTNDEPTEENIQNKSSWLEDAAKALGFEGNREEFQALYCRKVYETTIDDNISTSSTTSESWLKRDVRHEESFALAE